MNSSAANGPGKWANGSKSRQRWAVIGVFALLCALPQSGVAAGRRFWGLPVETPPKLRAGAVQVTHVPLPRPRPPEAPAKSDTAAGTQPPEGGHRAPAATEAAPPPGPSACRQALTEDIAIAPSIPPIRGPGACGGDDLVRLEAIVLPDRHRVAMDPPATMRCTMARAIADWVRTDIAPLVANLGTTLTGLVNYDSYECRGFNNIAGAHLSEHGHANALDVHSFKLADGREVSLVDRNQPRLFRENVLYSMCTRFSTVLGPGSDWYHEDHIHIDLAQRRNNYKICEWDVLDPLPKVAPLLPAARPADAPPREKHAGDSE